MVGLMVEQLAAQLVVSKVAMTAVPKAAMMAERKADMRDCWRVETRAGLTAG